jgi:hypothetical protein
MIAAAESVLTAAVPIRIHRFPATRNDRFQKYFPAMLCSSKTQRKAILKNLLRRHPAF